MDLDVSFRNDWPSGALMPHARIHPPLEGEGRRAAPGWGEAALQIIVVKRVVQGVSADGFIRAVTPPRICFAMRPSPSKGRVGFRLRRKEAHDMDLEENSRKDLLSAVDSDCAPSLSP